MNSLNLVPRISHLLRQGSYSQALSLMAPSLEIITLQLRNDISKLMDPLELGMSIEESLVLAKAHLLLGNYPESVRCALFAKDILNTLEPFYQESILFHMMNRLLALSKIENRNANEEYKRLRELVLDIIKDDPLDDSVLGFLTEIREYELLKKKIVELSNTDLNCRELLDTILDTSFEDLCDVFFDCSTKNPIFLEYIIDAYVFKNRYDDLIKYVLNLPWDKMYAACFYLEDSHPKLVSENGWSQDNNWKREINNILRMAKSPGGKSMSGRNSPAEANGRSSPAIAESNGRNSPANGDANRKNNSSIISRESFENVQKYMQNAEFILTGEWKKEIMSHFMMKNSKTSFKFLEAMSKCRAPFISLCNSIMNAKTTNDTLYRNNRGLLTGREWTRFIEYSCIGMVHHGNTDGFEILKEILPSIDVSSGEPGALMALGAMSAGYADQDVTEFLLNWIDSPSDEMVFGACMGLGLNLIVHQDLAVVEKLKSLLSIDSTIAQESALYAIGMICAGSGNSEIIDFISAIAEKTDFPRVKRVCGVALSLVTILNDPEDSVFSMLKSFDSTDRASALLSLGSSYVATGYLNVIKNILPFINDGDDDTKRAAVIAIALVGYLDPLIKSSILIPLAQNHNPHVRGAVALSLGLLNSGLGDQEVCSLLEALLYDSDDIVVQSACIGAGFALVQCNPDVVPNYKRTLDKINLIIASKDESSCAKIGASIGRSIAEVGGRSAVFSLKNHVGQIDEKRVAGAILILNSFYWYPLLGCMSLMILPTPLFYFNSSLEHTSDVFENDSKYYDYLVRIPEIRKSRRFKMSSKPPTEVTDKKTDAPKGLTSGDRITLQEMLDNSMETGVIFKD